MSDQPDLSRYRIDPDEQWPTVEQALDAVAERISGVMGNSLVALGELLASPLNVRPTPAHRAFAQTYGTGDVTPKQLLGDHPARKRVTIINSSTIVDIAAVTVLWIGESRDDVANNAGAAPLQPGASYTHESNGPLWVRPSDTAGSVSLIIEEYAP